MGRRIIRSLKTEKGYSMVELLVTMAILVIIATPLAAYFVVGAQNNRLAREQMQAAQLAQRVMESWKASPTIATPTLGDTGIFTVSTVSEEVDRLPGDLISGGTQTGYTPLVEAPPPVPGDISDYDYAPVGADAVTDAVPIVIKDAPGGYSITINGITYITVPNNYTLNIEFSTVDPLLTQISFTGTSLTHTMSKTLGSVGAPARVTITMDCVTNINLNAGSAGPKGEVYIFQGVNGLGQNYPDNVIAVPSSPNVKIYENLSLSLAADAGFDPARVYQITVVVSKNGHEIINLVSYKRIE